MLFCFVIVGFCCFGFFFLSLLFCKATSPPPAPARPAAPQRAPGPPAPAEPPRCRPAGAEEGGGAASPVALAPGAGFQGLPDSGGDGGNPCGKPAVFPGGGGGGGLPAARPYRGAAVGAAAAARLPPGQGPAELSGAAGLSLRCCLEKNPPLAAARPARDMPSVLKSLSISFASLFYLISNLFPTFPSLLS